MTSKGQIGVSLPTTHRNKSNYITQENDIRSNFSKCYSLFKKKSRRNTVIEEIKESLNLLKAPLNTAKSALNTPKLGEEIKKENIIISINAKDH